MKQAVMDSNNLAAPPHLSKILLLEMPQDHKPSFFAKADGPIQPTSLSREELKAYLDEALEITSGF